MLSKIDSLWKKLGYGGQLDRYIAGRYAAELVSGNYSAPIAADLRHYYNTGVAFSGSDNVIYKPHGSHADGLNSVPFDNYRANLHKNEMVLTADVANHIRESMSAGSKSPQVIVQTDPALIAELQQLRTEVAALRSEQSSFNSKAEQQRAAQTDATETLVRTNRTPVKMP